MTSRSLPEDPPSYYEAHVFVCTNERPAGHPRGSCAPRGSQGLRDYLKARLKELGLVDRVRPCTASCLDRCELGPTVVIYPEAVWYTCHSREDMEEILQTHLLGGGRVERLLLRPDQTELRPEQRPAAA